MKSPKKGRMSLALRNVFRMLEKRRPKNPQKLAKKR